MTDHTGRPTFKKSGFLQQGYGVEDVDAFLDQVYEAIGLGRPIPDIESAQFTVTRSGGYDMFEVDAFLDDLIADLASDQTADQASEQAVDLDQGSEPDGGSSRW